jgi:hypothetical protein
MVRWERLEQFLVEKFENGGEFTQAEYASALGLPGREATADIRAYLDEQRKPNDPETGRPRSRALFLIHRQPGTRTSLSVWDVTAKHYAADALLVGQAFVSDTRCRFERAVELDLKRIAIKNPRAAKRVRRQIGAIAEGALVMLDAAVQGALDDD